MEETSKLFKRNFLNSNQEINNLLYTSAYQYQVVDNIPLKTPILYNTQAVSNK